MRHGSVLKRLELLKLRLKETPNWFPVPAFLSIGFAVILYGHLVINLNPRLGSSVQLIEGIGDSKDEWEGAILFQISIKDDDVYVVTPERNVYSWSSKDPESRDFKDFRVYLAQKSQKMLTEVSINRRITYTQSSVVLSTDQAATWYHVHPIVTALAEAGFDSYGFEFKKLGSSHL
jgi:hypothetical protein